MITGEEKKRRREIHETNFNISLSGFDDEYIKWRLSHKTEEDLIYERWINGEIEFDEVVRLVEEYIKNL